MKVPAFYAVALCLLLAAPAAHADEQAASPGAGKLTLKVDPALQKREAAYKAAVKALTADQQATLKSADDEFMKTVTPGIQFLATSAQVDACKAKAGSPIAKEASKYDSEVKVLRSKIQAAQAEDRAQLHELRGKQITFIDQKLVDDHLALLAQITEGVGKGMVQATIAKGGFDNTDCAEVAQTLDTVFAPGTTGDGAGDAAALQKKADAGDLDALTTLGMLHISGKGFPKDFDAGVALLTQAADKGYDRAQYLLGLAYATDTFGGTPDKAKAKYWLKKSADQGDKKALEMLGQVDNAKPAEGIDSLHKRAEGGDKEAQYLLGFRYYQGSDGAEKNADEALKWLLLAAGQGQPEAQSNVALLLLNQNRAKEAVDWMTKAANNGVSNSQISLADLYLEGKVVPKDEDKAVFWYKKAADAGDSRAVAKLKDLGKL